MNTATNRMKALVAGGAALAAFGLGAVLPATATPPTPGSVGQAGVHANPPGQSEGDHNKGFTCDGNGGVGSGNPALNPTCKVPPPPGDEPVGGDNPYDT